MMERKNLRINIKILDEHRKFLSNSYWGITPEFEKNIFPSTHEFLVNRMTFEENFRNA